ncbi:PhzF family phenazine biosynthesis protein [Undibacterium cyanobacteriorum]|uniref:PhzF family phenazine biosynthesis protein n=1 Tax=Undibacterium cyanobacteriorum TaxID=3073561 RepID=A0ABY9RIZ1_9BURK|nr:PhzF family phenazine biosynthesis protein [Undibacterium sp. 20NA77.5]WMW80245.1 PhzF family phenazine biosynthesis protein [Undibacterium sp. 20NA77.5]
MMSTSLFRIASFSDQDRGGNPAGVWLGDSFPSDEEMQALAKELAYSETVFAIPLEQGWRVRYFSPESEVPFCGHATIALGAVLAQERGEGTYALQLNHGQIQVEGKLTDNGMYASLQSPPTMSKDLDPALLEEVLALFNLDVNQLDTRLPPAWMHGGADHVVLVLKDRETLSSMRYDLDLGKALMRKHQLVTIMLVYVESNQLFHSRNAFASGGVYEDPATGAASAAFAGYLRDSRWPHQGFVRIIQGEDMGMRSVIEAEFNEEKGSSIRISGAARVIV